MAILPALLSESRLRSAGSSLSIQLCGLGPRTTQKLEVAGLTESIKQLFRSGVEEKRTQVHLAARARHGLMGWCRTILEIAEDQQAIIE